MKKTLVALIGLMLALAVAVPATSQDWIDKSTLTTTEKFLTTLPADFYLIDPAAAQKLMDDSDSTDTVNVIGPRLLRVLVLLCDENEHAVAAHHIVHQAD